jgi:hypothetical protein
METFQTGNAGIAFRKVKRKLSQQLLVGLVPNNRKQLGA